MKTTSISDRHQIAWLWLWTGLWLLLSPMLAADTGLRVKGFVTQGWLDDHDLAARIGARHPLDADLDLRFTTSRSSGAWSGTWHHSLVLEGGDSLAGSTLLDGLFSGDGLSTRQGSDERTLMDLAGHIDRGDRHQWTHRADRLNVRYSGQSWNVVAGREAITFGAGLVFNPMDLLNPFAPSAVDKDFKPGEDLLQVQHRLRTGGEVSLLAVGRRNGEGEATLSASSLAFHYTNTIAEGEIEVLAAQHRDEGVLGVGVRWPLAGAMLRSDIVATALDGDEDVRVSALLNADYSFSLGDKLVHVYGEYYHNGFGVEHLDPVKPLPEALTRRLLVGELFVLGRNYLAVGGSITWHALVSQSVSLVTSLQDGSSFLQTTATIDVSSSSRLDIGALVQTGSAGDEFGGLPIARATDGELITVGTGHRVYLRWTWYPSTKS